MCMCQHYDENTRFGSQYCHRRQDHNQHHHHHRHPLSSRQHEHRHSLHHHPTHHRWRCPTSKLRTPRHQPSSRTAPPPPAPAPPLRVTSQHTGRPADAGHVTRRARTATGHVTPISAASRDAAPPLRTGSRDQGGYPPPVYRPAASVA